MGSKREGWTGLSRPVGLAPYKPARWVPQRGGRHYWIWRGERRYQIEWHRKGMFRLRSVLKKGEQTDRPFPSPDLERRLMKRRSVVGASSAPVPPLALGLPFLAEYPAFSEFLTATSYEDGTSRSPCYVWINNRRTFWEMTLFDVDAGARAPVTGLTLAEALIAAELHLGCDVAPWQQDKFLQEQLAKRKKK